MIHKSFIILFYLLCTDIAPLFDAPFSFLPSFSLNINIYIYHTWQNKQEERITIRMVQVNKKKKKRSIFGCIRPPLECQQSTIFFYYYDYYYCYYIVVVSFIRIESGFWWSLELCSRLWLMLCYLLPCRIKLFFSFSLSVCVFFFLLQFLYMKFSRRFTLRKNSGVICLHKRE